MKDVVERLGAVGIDAESVALGNGDGPAGGCAGRDGFPLRRLECCAALVPDGGGELGAGRVGRAYKQQAGTCRETVGHAAGGRPPRWSAGRVVVGRSVADHLQTGRDG